MEHRASFTLAEPLAAGTSLSFGLTVLSSAANDEMTHIGVNVSAGDGKQPFVDKRRSSLRAAVPPVFLDLMTTDPLSPSLTTNITAFVDGHVLETFFDDSLALTTTVYPQSEESTRFGLFLRCEGDVTVVASAQAWALRPIVLKQRSTTAASEVGAGERKSPGVKTDDCTGGLARQLLALQLLAGAPLGASLDNGLALTPIMGWNPWYTYGKFPGGTESNVLLAANALKEKGLVEAGYDIVGLDCGYSTKHRDAAGNLVVNTTRFPRGIKWLAEQIHALGLRFGMYAGQGYAQCCSGSEDKNATDGSGPGCSKDKQHPTCRSTTYYERDAKLWATEWSIDLLKFDGCGGPFSSVDAMRLALNATGRPIVFAINQQAVAEAGGMSPALANQWRSGPDIKPVYEVILDRALRNNNVSVSYLPGASGAWNDPDFLQIGNIERGGWQPTPPPPAIAAAEGRTQMALWCLMKAPLFLSTFLHNMTDENLRTVTNKAAIAVNQDALGEQGTLRKSGGWIPNGHNPTNAAFGFQIWSGALSHGRVAVVLANLDGNSTQSITLTNDEMPPHNRVGEGQGGGWDIVEAFTGKATSNKYLPQTATVAPHDVVLWTLTPALEMGAGERKSPGAKTDDCSSGLASRQWSSIRAGIFDELKGEDAQPFMLTGSPVEAWPALKRWTPAFVADQIGEVPNVRRSEQPRFLFWTIDTFSSELARNEEFWQLVDGGNTELGSSPIAHKNFRWARPHRLHPTVSGARFSKSVAGRGKRGRYTYAAVDPYETRAARALLDDISPLEELAARREDDHRRWRINIWMGSENSTATPHYDSYHNIVKWRYFLDLRAVASLTRKASLLQHIQITGQKTWWLQTPAGLRRHKIFPVRLQRYVGVTSRL